MTALHVHFALPASKQRSFEGQTETSCTLHFAQVTPLDDSRYTVTCDPGELLFHIIPGKVKDRLFGQCFGARWVVMKGRGID